MGIRPPPLEVLVMRGFWAGRRVLVTGHTGFKGAWLSWWLAEMGAQVSGLALPPETNPNMHDLLGLSQRGHFVHADITDRAVLTDLFAKAQPEVVFHLAAQALVRHSYATPVETFSANVLGTVCLLDAVRRCPTTQAVVVVTSDKAYENLNLPRGYHEGDVLGGHDPYSASKACAETATSSMRRAYFGVGGHKARIASVRAGNVIGGGDWAQDRLVPDIVRGCLGPDGIVHLRNPAAVRPWQHVLEPLNAYLLLAERLCTTPEGMDEAWNIGPEASENRPVRAVAQAVVAAFGRGRIEITPDESAPHEAHFLTLDCTKAHERLGWHPRLSFEKTIAMTADWYSAWARSVDVAALTTAQITTFMETGA